MTHSEENYLKAIFHLGEHGIKSVSTNAIAKQMMTKPSSVTDMVKRLSEKGLVRYKKYQGVTLSQLGTKMALSVVRKHRLWEVFLVERLNFAWDEVHEVAEQLEHIESEKLTDRLDALLGFPKYDPHGDPIPNKEGKFYERDKKVLSEVPIAEEGVCIGMKNSSKPFLKFLDNNQIRLGDKITILSREEFDGSLQIKIRDNQLRISNEIAANLYLQLNA